MLTIAADIGGTFTDLVAVDGETGEVRTAKTSTDAAAPALGVERCLEKAGLDPRAAGDFLHGSTVAINAVIQRRGVPTALITTAGTRDVYEIGRGGRPDAYNLFFRRTDPLVERSWVFEVAERISAQGEVLKALPDADVVAAVQSLRRRGARAVAICLLNSYANPSHEQRAEQIVGGEAPDIFVSRSSGILREYREYERTATTVVNAYVGPIVRRYLEQLDVLLRRRGFAGRLLIMQSNGGVMTPAVAQAQPVRTMESGPVGGSIAAAKLARRLSLSEAVAFDMGGTTAKAALIRNGELQMAEGYIVGDQASGHPVMLPVVDVVEVGTGGGSVAFLDSVGELHVGPKSAGGQPGPVCYGWGGTQPTVTDANAVLGRLGADSFLGGEMPLDVDAARAAIDRDIAGPLGLGVEDAARAIVDIAVNSMALAVRAVSVERGIDPRSCTLIAFGGAGPLHAAGVARQLHIPVVVVPPSPAHFSAIGMLLADLRHDTVRTVYRRLDDTGPETLATVFEELAAETDEVLSRQGVSSEAVQHLAFLDLRYVGQEFTVRTPVVMGAGGLPDMAATVARFSDLHLERFGHKAHGEPVEAVNARLVGVVERRQEALASPRWAGAGQGAPATERQVVLSAAGAGMDAGASGRAGGGRRVSCPVVQRGALRAGDEVAGPAIIAEYASTIFLEEGDVAAVDAGGAVTIRVGEIGVRCIGCDGSDR